MRDSTSQPATTTDGAIPGKIEMLRARAELYRGLALVGSTDHREGRLAMAAYFERMAREAAQAQPVAAAAASHSAPSRH